MGKVPFESPSLGCRVLIGDNRNLLLWGEWALKPLWLLFLVLVIHHWGELARTILPVGPGPELVFLEA